MGDARPAEEWSEERGSLRVSYPAPGVVRTTGSGFATVDLAGRLVKWVDVAIAAGEKPNVFHDWWDVTGYEPPVRRMMATWYSRVFHDVRGVHVLSSSKIVTMGVGLVSIAMGNAIVSYKEREALEAAIAAAIRAAQRVP
jgi:hypothetical protein